MSYSYKETVERSRRRSALHEKRASQGLCPHCGHPPHHPVQARLIEQGKPSGGWDSWEDKQCDRTGCGYVRRMKVSYYIRYREDDEEEGAPLISPTPCQVDISWQRLCKACDWERAATVHEQQARIFRHRAYKERQRRRDKESGR